MKRYEISGASYEDELTEDGSGPLILHADHAAFVERVRGIAESLGHDPDCPYFFKSCNCPRGKLLDVCNG